MSTRYPFHQALWNEEGRPLRRTAKKVDDPERIHSFLQKASVGYLGLVDEEGTYVVPLNFVWWNDRICFHGAEEGRKSDALKHSPTVCFTVAEEHGTITNPVPAHTGTAYFSVMLFGRVEKVDDPAEATQVLDAMLNKYVPGYFSRPLSHKHVETYRSSMGSPTAVHRLFPIRVTAKEHRAYPDELFYPGKTIHDDLKTSR